MTTYTNDAKFTEIKVKSVWHDMYNGLWQSLYRARRALIRRLGLELNAVKRQVNRPRLVVVTPENR